MSSESVALVVSGSITGWLYGPALSLQAHQEPAAPKVFCSSGAGLSNRLVTEAGRQYSKFRACHACNYVVYPMGKKRVLTRDQEGRPGSPYRHPGQTMTWDGATL